MKKISKDLSSAKPSLVRNVRFEDSFMRTPMLMRGFERVKPNVEDLIERLAL